MKTKLLMTVVVAAGLVMPATAAAQFDDPITTWVLWDYDTDPPTPFDDTWADFSQFPIPANFFDPGSDPFTGRVEMRGFHDEQLRCQGGSNDGNACSTDADCPDDGTCVDASTDIDTIVRRAGDPLPPSAVPGETASIPIEIVQLRLVSIEPITVTNGTDQSFWDVDVRLSPAPAQQGTLTATKTHANGGTFDADFPLFPLFIFTNTEDPTDQRFLDYSELGLGPLQFVITGAPWVHFVNLPDLIFDENSAFHPFVDEDPATGQQTEVPGTADTVPGTDGPIVRHKICLPKPKRYCIYQIDCKSGTADNPNACEQCPYECELCRAAPCPNLTCSTGFATTCKGSDCCLNFSLVDCRPPKGIKWCPKVQQVCFCDPQPGACCTADGACTVTEECLCDGTWLGPNTDCGTIGGCCFDDGSCVDGVYQACCELMMGGTFEPAGCTGVTGKCCLADGTCRDGVDESCCDGVFFPDSSCLPPEECCIQGDCVMMDPECCLAFNGAPGGAGSVCDPPQKCCLPDGSCADLEPDCCRELDGVPGQGLCDFQACCVPGGACINTDPECCTLILGGSSKTGTCEPLEACCFGDNSCSMLEPRCCIDEGGTPEGAGTTCDPVGACCIDSDGDGLVDTCEQMSEECCLDIPGSRFHAGDDCLNVGACCFDADGDGVNESCTDISQACCQDLPGGTFHGAGSSCSTAGACCFDADNDGTAESCEVMDRLCCQDLLGSFLGGGTVCLNDNDGDGIDDACGGGGTDPCPLATDWCQNLQATDCADGLANELCWPRRIRINTQGQPIVDECDCIGDECGPIDIFTQPGTTDLGLRCLNSCPDPLQPCQFHYNGTPTGLTSTVASAIPVGVTVTCECPEDTPDPCPLPGDPDLDPCRFRQQTDCQDGLDTEECRPHVVTFSSNGVPVAKTCDCYGDTGDCGPVTIIGDLVSCEEQCLPPRTGECVVFADGVSTGKKIVNVGDVPVGAALICDCDDPPTCGPNAAQDACEGTCPDPNDICAAQCVEFDPATGTTRVTACDCDGQDQCHVEYGAGITPFCSGDCPPGQICVESRTVDPDTGIETICCDCVDNPICEPADDGLSCKPTTCPDPSQKCVPQVIVFDPFTGLFRVTQCECQNEKECHVDVDLSQPNLPIVCVGDCPSGETCEQFTSVTAAGEVQVRCDCVPVQEECRPNDARTDCIQTVCPDPAEVCRPVSVTWIPGTVPFVNECDCVKPDEECHVEFDSAGPFCVGICPPGETCELFGFDTDSDGIDDLWRCDCVPVELECGPDPTEQWCNPVTCPNANEVCVPIVIDIDPFNNQIRVKECECLPAEACHVTYDPASLQPFCEGTCPTGETCELFGLDINGDGVNDRFACDCVPDSGECAPTADGQACQQTTCPDTTQVCLPRLIAVDAATGESRIIDCDCMTDTDCHVALDASNQPFCQGTCPDGQTCELRSADSDGDGVDDTFGCDCVPDTSDVCEPNATRTDCKQTTCPTPGEICRPIVVGIGPNGQVVVEKCDCLNVEEDCHVEFDAANQPYCVGICPPGEVCELLGKDTNNDGIDDKFKCDCVPPTTECEPDDTGQACLPTICPNVGEYCIPRVISWVQGADPVIEECECSSTNECHVEFDFTAQAPHCIGECPDGTECKLFGVDSDGDGARDRWKCDCVPVGGECGPTDDGSTCRPVACPEPNEECLPTVVSGVPGGGVLIEECACADPTLCHLEVDADNQPFCTGECPTGTECKLFTVDLDGDGIDDRFRCACVPIEQQCEPTTDGLGCNEVSCPDPTHVCVPQQVTCTSDGECRVTACECVDPELCHVVLNPPLTDPPVACTGACPDGQTCGLFGGIDIVTGTTTYDCRCITKPVVVEPADDILKGRYLGINRSAPSIAGGTTAGAPLEIIRVRMVDLDGYPGSNGTVLWAGPPFDAPDENAQQPGATMRASALQCEPYFHDWPSEGVVNIFGAEIVPNSTYHVQVATSDCPDLDDEDCYSDVAIFETGVWGDVTELFDDDDGPNPVQPDFNDINGVVLKFLAMANAPPKAQSQLQPNVVFPGRAIDFRDVAASVNGFLGIEYSSIYHGPCTCPSSVTCGATACSGDNDCGAGFCVDGFCTDECARCAP